MERNGALQPSTSADAPAGLLDFIVPWADRPETVVDITGAEPAIRTNSRDCSVVLAEAQAEIVEMKAEIRRLRESSGAATVAAKQPESVLE